MIRIISYNVYFGKRIKKIIAWLKQEKRADIVCFQEFPKLSIRECIKALSDTPYHYRFAPSLKIRKKIYGQLTLFRTDRIQLASSSIIHLGAGRIEKMVLRTTIPRHCLVTVFETKRKRFTLVNTHLISLAATKIRYKQIQHIIKSIRTKHTPSLIIGDFNLHTMKTNTKLILFMKSYGFKTIAERLATHRVSILKHQMDYVFGARCTIRNIEAPRVKFSDHYPVIAQVTL